MKFPRNAKLLRNQLDATPFAAVFFLLVIFLMLGALVPTPGLPLKLPDADDLPGTDKPTIAVAVDANNRLFFANQIVNETELKQHLREAAAKSPEALTLVVQADESLSYKNLVRLNLIARDAGIHDILLATLPRLIAAPEKRPALLP